MKGQQNFLLTFLILATAQSDISLLMDLTAILPRSLEKQPPEIVPDSCTILLSLIMNAHLDRANARILGWRGVKPAGETAMTCKVAEAPYIYGIAFTHEIAADSKNLKGYFNLYVFPEADAEILESFSLAALQISMDSSYPFLIRDFENNLEILSPFLCGQLILSAPLAGTALSLTLDSWVKLRVTVPEGIRINNDWVIAPGEADSNLPAFHLLLPLFTTISKTASVIFHTEPALFYSCVTEPGYSISNAGTLEQNLSAKLRKAILTAEYFDTSRSPFLKFWGTKDISPNILARKNGANTHKILPVLHIVTGFLGAGKTTFLKQWLDFLHSRERYTGVIQNEFGPIDLDTTLLKDDTVVEALDDGCVCCSLADSLRPGLQRILHDLPAHQFILETTGVANPANVRAELHNLSDLVAPGLTICVTDVTELSKNGFPKKGVLLDQIQFSDVIILNKMDTVAEFEQQSVLTNFSAKVAKINPDAIILPAQNGIISFALLDNLPSSLASKNFIQKGTFLTHIGDGYEKMGLEFLTSVAEGKVSDIIKKCGNVARAKGIIEVDKKGATIIQYVNGTLELLPAPGKKPTGLSIIGKNLTLPDSCECRLKQEG